MSVFLIARNTILYGPPGTGKTYRTTALALRCIEQLNEAVLQEQYPTRAAVQQQAQHYRQAGQLATVVFHPSFAYEDFVEGIKPHSNERGELRYAVEDGIFKQLCVRAAHALYRTQQQNTLEAPPLRRSFDALFYEFIDYLRRTTADDSAEVVFESKTGKPFYLVDINQHQTLLLKMGQGRKTYAITRRMLAQLYQQFAAANDIQVLSRDLPAAVRGVGSVAWAVFNRLKHYEETRNQAYRYLLDGSSAPDAAQYQAMKRDLLQLDYDSLSPADYEAAGRFVLVVDEINRGNVAAIFGELIVLLEDDKRAGQPEALTSVLPYSRETLSVPPNLYLIGTMNTADRSVEPLDTALRRRFVFVAVPPDSSLLGPVSVVARASDEPEKTELNLAAEVAETYLSADKIEVGLVLDAINQRLGALLDADHQIGHGYLMGAMHASRPLNKLREVIYRQIIPLLQEYFYDDAAQVIRIVGDDFFDITSSDVHLLDGPSTASQWSPSDTPPVYRIKPLTDRDFIRALQRIYHHE